MPSRTAEREPARFTTSVLPETPTRPREMPASTAPAARPEARSASAMAWIGRSRTACVASGGHVARRHACAAHGDHEVDATDDGRVERGPDVDHLTFDRDGAVDD